MSDNVMFEGLTKKGLHNDMPTKSRPLAPSGQSMGTMHYDEKLIEEYAKGNPIENAKSHLKTLDLLDKEIAKNKELKFQLHNVTALKDTAVLAIEKQNAKMVELTEPFVDEEGSLWERPTAWAYAQVCKARTKWQNKAEEAQVQVEHAEEALVKSQMEKTRLILQIKELHAQFAMMRGALERAKTGFNNLVEFNILPPYEGYDVSALRLADLCHEVLMSTLKEASDRVQGLVDALNKTIDIHWSADVSEYVGVGDARKAAKEALAKWRGEDEE